MSTETILDRLSDAAVPADLPRNAVPSSAPSEAATRADAKRRQRAVLGMRVDELTYGETIAQVTAWAARRESRYICVSTVHMVMECYDSRAFRQIVNEADLVTADSVPVTKVSRWLGLRRQEKVAGPELVARLCGAAAEAGLPVGFYGSTPDVIADLTRNLTRRYPGLRVAYAESPPFRALTAEEQAETAAAINASGASILFVGLGCPKQERWMSQMHPATQAVMLGVGWAFDVLAGRSRNAPRLIEDFALQWLYRLILNPRKLWKRHLRHNPRFIVLAILQLCGLRTYGVAGAAADAQSA